MLSWAAFAVVSVACVSCSRGAREEAQSSPVVDSSVIDGVRAAVSEARAVFGKDSVPAPGPFFTMLDSTVRVLRADIAGRAPEARVKALARVIYDDWGVAFDPNQDDLLSLLPHTIVARQRGSCLGVSLIFLMLAERTGVPLHGVLLPGHFFVRYDDGETGRNIEPNRRAYAHPESYYRRRYGVAEGSWYDLRNLSAPEALAVLRYNLGNIYRGAGRLDRAAASYRACVAVLPGFAAAWGNYAIALDALGKEDGARAAFHRARELRPGLPNLARNLGAFELQHARPAAALRAYRWGLARDPEDAALHYGIGLAQCALGRGDSAEAALTRLERTPSGASLARALGTALSEGCGRRHAR